MRDFGRLRRYLAIPSPSAARIARDVKTELLIFLTPHVVQTPEDLPRVSSDERAKMDLAPKAFQKGDMERYIGK